MAWNAYRINDLRSQLEGTVHIPWVVASGCCRIEIENASAATYNWRRLGVQELAVHPSEADLMIVAGWINPELRSEIELVYSQLRGRKSVIAVGACALSGSPYLASGETPVLASDILPVDVFVPGCPPRPELILDAIRLLKEKIVPGPDHESVLHEALRDVGRG